MPLFNFRFQRHRPFAEEVTVARLNAILDAIESLPITSVIGGMARRTKAGQVIEVRGRSGGGNTVVRYDFSCEAVDAVEDSPAKLIISRGTVGGASWDEDDTFTLSDDGKSWSCTVTEDGRVDMEVTNDSSGNFVSWKLLKGTDDTTQTDTKTYLPVVFWTYDTGTITLTSESAKTGIGSQQFYRCGGETDSPVVFTPIGGL